MLAKTIDPRFSDRVLATGPEAAVLKRWLGAARTTIPVFNSCVLLLVLGLGAVAQEAPTPTYEDTKFRFDAKFDEYKQILREIEQQRIDYQVADEATREQINTELSDRVVRAQRSIDELVDLALEAYQLGPNNSEEVTQLLLVVAQHFTEGRTDPPGSNMKTGGDQYEKAMPIINALIDGGCEMPMLPLWGLVSAYATNEYELAENYLQQALEKDLLTRPDEVSDPTHRAFMELAWKFANSTSTYRKKWEYEKTIREAEAAADDLPQVKLSTTKGDIVVELFENEAPIAVANFITLVKKGYYDGLSFHRVLPGFMAQSGCPEGTGSGGPGYCIPDECRQPNHRMHFRGSLSMAKTPEPDTGGSQFFLTLVPTDHLNGQHTVFGRVMDGIDVLAELQARSPTGDPNRDQALPEPDIITSAVVLRDRGHAYDFKKLPAR